MNREDLLLNPGDLFMHQQRQRAILSLLAREKIFPLDGKRILEIGCGSARLLREFLWFGAPHTSLTGVELQYRRLQDARMFTPHLPLINADGSRLPFEDASFDLVLQFTVFSSILDDDVRRRVASEMLRVLQPGGLALWYDFRFNPTNRRTRGISAAEIRGLFPNCRVNLQWLTLAPPLARMIAPFSPLTCGFLERLRVFNTHYLAAIRPQRSCPESPDLPGRQDV